MIIMVFKNINQIQIQIQKKKKLYTYRFGLLSLLQSIFFANLEPRQKPKNFKTEDQSYRIHQKIKPSLISLIFGPI